jgi:hypothetical protein
MEWMGTVGVPLAKTDVGSGHPENAGFYSLGSFDDGAESSSGGPRPGVSVAIAGVV